MGFLYLATSGDHSQVVREQILPSGKVIQITACNLVWGVEHDERDLGKDSFALEYVSLIPDADPRLREQEALEVFELIRPVSEQWGFKMATLSGFRTTKRTGAYDIFNFTRSAGGKWSCQRIPAKVHIND